MAKAAKSSGGAASVAAMAMAKAESISYNRKPSKAYLKAEAAWRNNGERNESGNGYQQSECMACGVIGVMASSWRLSLANEENENNACQHGNIL